MCGRGFSERRRPGVCLEVEFMFVEWKAGSGPTCLAARMSNVPFRYRMRNLRACIAF